MSARPDLWARWEEIDPLLERALEQPPAARHLFLLEACGGDTELLAAVTDLLTASLSAESELDRPGPALLDAVFASRDAADVAPLAPGTRVGRYRLDGELGRGGMATVYRAERVDGVFEQSVAIKILRPELERAGIAGRFLAERRILSTLAHPNIARILDGGSTEDGRPYLVMELVAGDPITVWANARRLTIAQRLDLFRQVAATVQFAHTRLIVHRDLKPSNVLVTADGKVKLLDFGIAKLLEGAAQPALETAPVTRWMTPAYASPEQIRGEPVTTATDVYAAGALLFELLTGTRPFGKGQSGFELERAICEVPAPRPSAVVAGRPDPENESHGGNSDDPRPRQLAGDLDAILLKALRKDPEERYPSMQALLEDIDRHRAGFPVGARDGLWAYRARKFIGRNRWQAGAVAVLASVLVGSGAILIRQQLQTARERDRANQAALQAATAAENSQLVIDFLADVFRGRDPGQAPSDTLTARELLEWGHQRVRTEFGDRPALQASLLQVMATAHYNLGLLDESVALHEEAVAATGRAFGEDSKEEAEALLLLAGAHSGNRNWYGATPPAQAALRIREALVGPTDPSTAEVWRVLADIQANLMRPDSAGALMERAERVQRLALGTDDPAYVATLLDLARIRRAQGRLDEAERLYEEGIPKYRRLKGDDSDAAVYLNNLAFLKRTRGDFLGAAPLYQEALDTYVGQHSRGHPTSLMLASNLASSLHFAGLTDEATEVLRQNVEAAHTQWPEGHWRVASAEEALGKSLLRSGRLQESEEHLRAAVVSYRDLLGPQHDQTTFAEAALAVLSVLTGHADTGGPYLERFYAYLHRNWAESDQTLSVDLSSRLGSFLYVLEDTGLTEQFDRFRALLPPETQLGPSGR